MNNMNTNEDIQRHGAITSDDGTTHVHADGTVHTHETGVSSGVTTGVSTGTGGHNVVTGEEAHTGAGKSGLATGAVVGGLIGTAVGGPVGAVVGGALGSLAGGVAGDAAEADDENTSRVV